MAKIKVCKFCGVEHSRRGDYCSASHRTMYHELTKKLTAYYAHMDAIALKASQLVEKYPHLKPLADKSFRSTASKLKSHYEKIKA